MSVFFTITISPLFTYKKRNHNIPSRDGETTDVGVWLGNWIYVALLLIHTLCNSLQHTREVLSACCVFTTFLVAASKGGRSSLFVFRNVPSFSYSNSRLTNYQAGGHLTPNSYSSYSTPINCPAINTSALTAQKAPLFCCSLWAIA
jgi:hypothetical protein